MLRLYLVEKDGPRRFDLGTYPVENVSDAINSAERRHRFLAKLETHQFEYVGHSEPKPLRQSKPAFHRPEQLSMV